MKKRRVVVSLELDTDAPLSALRKINECRLWAIIKGELVCVVDSGVEQSQANVITIPKP